MWEARAVLGWWDGWSLYEPMHVSFTACYCILFSETNLHLSRWSLLCINNHSLYSSTWPPLCAAGPFGMTSFQSETGPWAVSQQRPCHTQPLATCPWFVYLSVSLLLHSGTHFPLDHKSIKSCMTCRVEVCVCVCGGGDVKPLAEARGAVCERKYINI